MTGAKRAAAPAKMPVSDAAVRAKTGRSWAQWCAALDRAKADGLSHREIVAMLHAKFAVGDWWAQMVTVGYERARGKRAVNQTAQGFRTNISRTIPSSASAVFAAWHDETKRDAWLPRQRFTIRTAIARQSLRITWPDGTDVEVTLAAKGPRKTVLAVQHGKLASAAAVRGAKSFWSERLDALRESLAR